MTITCVFEGIGRSRAATNMFGYASHPLSTSAVYLCRSRERVPDRGQAGNRARNAETHRHRA